MIYYYKDKVKEVGGFKEPASVPMDIPFFCMPVEDFLVIKTEIKLPLEEYTGDISKIYPTYPDMPLPTEENLNGINN